MRKKFLLPVILLASFLAGCSVNPPITPTPGPDPVIVTKYTISFDSNGGSGEMASIEMEEGEYILPECNFDAPQGKIFDYWEVNGQNKNPGDKIQISANITIKAIWKDKEVVPTKYTISFDANGGTGNMPSLSVDEGTMYSLPSCSFTAPASKEFDCWNINGVKNNPGDIVTITSDLIIKAIWKEIEVVPVTYVISFDSNGGSGSMASKTVDEGTTYTLPECGFSAPSGKEFDYWSVNGGIKNPGDNILVNQDLTIKAIWSDKSGQDIPVDYGFNHYNGYYGQLTWNDGEDLKAKLHAIISNNVNYLSYDDPNWESNTYADHYYDDMEMLDGVYSNDNIPASKTNTGWQREHVFAASLMTGKLTSNAVKTLGRATDFHNLVAGGQSGNSSRGNKNFGIANKDSSSYQNKGSYSFDEKNFEPSDEDKGRIARSIFYMDVMYSVTENNEYQPLTVVEDYVDFTQGNCQFAIGNFSTLLSWCDYSVNYQEMQHNESVYSHIYTKRNVAQNNRNPFVDYPELIDYIYGENKNESGSLSSLKPTEVSLQEVYGESIAHYAIKKAKREYEVGETLTKDDISLVLIGDDYKEVDVASSVFSVDNISFGSTGEREITITTDKNEITYVVNVKEKSQTYSYNYIVNDKNDFGGSTFGAGQSRDVTLNGQVWSATCQGEATLSNKNTPFKAVQIGSANKCAGTFTLVSAQSFTNVNRMRFALNSAANNRVTVVVTIGGTEAKTFNYTGNSSDLQINEYNIDPALSGIVSITISNLSGALYINSICINEVK